MNKYVLLMLLLAASVAQNTNTFTPATARDTDDTVFIGFGSYFYAFDLPSLALVRTVQVAANLSAPATFDGRFATFSDDKSGSYRFDTSNNFAFSYLPTTAAPESDYSAFPETTIDDAEGNSFTFQAGDDSHKATVTKKSPTGSVIAQYTLIGSNKPDGGFGHLVHFSLQGDRLYVIAAQTNLRSTYDDVYYAFSSTDLSLTDGPVTLPNSAGAGCPVPPRQCSVNVVSYITVYNEVVVYVYTKSTSVTQNNVDVSGPFQVTVATYSKECGFSGNFFDDQTLRPTAEGTGECGYAPSTAEEDGSENGVPSTSNGVPSSANTPSPTGSQAPTPSQGGSGSSNTESSNAPAVDGTINGGTNNGISGSDDGAVTPTQDRSQGSSAASLAASIVLVGVVAILL